jgi:hypothetical protein
MLHRGTKMLNLQARQALFSIFILTTEIIRGNFPRVPANLPGRPSAGRHTREDINA